jgi:hypothetical protein
VSGGWEKPKRAMRALATFRGLTIASTRPVNAAPALIAGGVRVLA